MSQTMEFTLCVSKCLGCHFCPQDALGATYSGERMMTVETFEACLRKLPEGTRVDFSGFSEPFLNPNACTMMHMARKAGREVYLYTTLVGLRECCVQLLNEAPPSYVRIHVPDMQGLIFPVKKWIEFHELFLKAKISATYMAMGEPEADIKTHLAIHNIVVERPDMLSRGGNLWDPGQKNGPIHCTMNRWHSNVVLPNGNVYGCCMDYSLSVPLGNLLTQDYGAIHDEAEKWRVNMERDATGSICAKCEWSQRR